MNSARWKQIEEIFHAALALPPAARADFVRESCAGDAEVQRAVEALLAADEASGEFIEKPALEMAAEAIAEAQPQPPTPPTTQLGAYQLLDLLGRGGMGEVHLAFDTRLNRKVAIKLLPQECTTDADRVRRFAQEARAASALNHPNILTIYDIGEAAGTHYIVTEYVEGETLRQRMTAAPHQQLSLTEVLAIAMQLCEALAAAHDAGIIHRDIKPDNVMVRRDGYVKVLDFGLAKLLQKDEGEGMKDELETTPHPSPLIPHPSTALGLVMGTPRYMSPEQARGEKVDARTDIFSLGVMLYEMSAGQTPFTGTTPGEMIAAILRDEPLPLTQLLPNVPPEVERILRQTLRKDRAVRYQTAREIFGDLQQLKKHLEFTVQSGATTLEQVATPDAEAMPLPPTPHSVAVLPFVNLSADAENEYFCDGLAEELLNALAKIEALKVAARTSAFSFKGKTTTISEISAALKVKTLLEGSVRKAGDNLRITVQLINGADGYQLWSERYDRKMKDIFDVQDEITLAVVEALKVKLLGAEKAAVLRRHTDNTEAYLAYLKGMYYRWKFAPEEFGKCLKYFQQAVDLDPSFALGYFGLASYYGYGSAWALLPIPPHEGWPQAEAAIAKTLELDATLPEGQLTLAAFRWVNHRDWAMAGSAIEHAALANPEFPEIHHLYSSYLCAAGQFDQAIAEAQQALALDPLSLQYSRSLGICFYYARQHDAAIAQFREALELEPNNPSVHEILGEVLARQGRFSEALTEWQRVVTLMGDAELATILNPASTAADFTNIAQAIARIKITRLRAGAESGSYVPAIAFAREYITLGEEENAFQWLRQACEERNVHALFINSDPFYDSLRGSHAFADLLRRIGL